MSTAPQTLEQLQIHIDAAEGHLAALTRRHQEINYLALKGDAAARAEADEIVRQQEDIRGELKVLSAAHAVASERRRQDMDVRSRADRLERAHKVQAAARTVADNAAGVDIALANLGEVFVTFVTSVRALQQFQVMDVDRLNNLLTGLKAAAVRAGLAEHALFSGGMPLPANLEEQVRAVARLPGELERLLAEFRLAEAA